MGAVRHEFLARLLGCKFFWTTNGYFSIGLGTMQLDDIVCILFGGPVPFILKRDGDYYELVGGCYVHGIMYGEAVDMRRGGLLEEQLFRLK